MNIFWTFWLKITPKPRIFFPKLLYRALRIRLGFFCLHSRGPLRQFWAHSVTAMFCSINPSSLFTSSPEDSRIIWNCRPPLQSSKQFWWSIVVLNAMKKGEEGDERKKPDYIMAVKSIYANWNYAISLSQ